MFRRQCPTLLAAIGILLALRAGWNAAKAATTSEDRVLKIAAFNVQHFGEDKLEDEFVANTVRKIVERYDVILIQEVRDRCGQSVRDFHDSLPHQYELAMSKRLGRSVSKEQYAFFYRSDRVTLLNEYQYEDPDDVFEREPFVIKIAPVFSPDDHVSLIALHSKPTDATAEIGNLTHVLTAVARKHRGSERIIMGDLNADCTYANYGKRIKANDYLTAHYHWLIDEDADTTAKHSTDCAYDRIIVKNLEDSFVVEDSAKIYNFTRWYRLNETQALTVSDHYPVEVKLQF